MNHPSRRAAALYAAAACAVAFSSADASAANKSWAAAVDGNWTTAVAWTPAGAPVNGDNAFLIQPSASNYLVTYDNPSTTQLYTFLTLNNTGGGEAQLRSGGGGVVYNVTQATVGGTGRGFWQVGSGVANLGSLVLASGTTGFGTVTLSSGSVTAGRIIVGDDGGGTFTQTGGVVEVDRFDVANNAGSTGHYSINGGTLTAGSINVNAGGTIAHLGGRINASTLTLNTGGVYSVSGNTGIGLFIQNGGTIADGYFINANDAFHYNSGAFTGHLSSFGTLTLNADMTISDGWANRSSSTVNALPAGRTLILNGRGLEQNGGTLTIAGGTLQTTTSSIGGTVASQAPVVDHLAGLHKISSELRLGVDTTAGTYNLNGGTLDVTGAAPTGASIGVDMPGQLNIVNGRASISHLRVGNGAAGTVNHSGAGDLFAPLLTVGAVSAGTYLQSNSGASVNVTNGLTIGAFGRYNMSAGTLFSAQTANNGSFTQTGGTANLNQVGGTGRMDIINTASLTVDRIRQDFLYVADTARIFTVANGGANGVSRLNNLFFEDFENLNFFGKWDLNNNDLVVDHDAAGAADNYDRIKRYIQSGFAGGSWNGNGLNSSAAIAAASTQDRTGLGYVKSTDIFSTFPASFVGQSVDNTAVLVRYTLLGDNNLNGTVEIGDFANLAANFNLPGDWIKGDYNYDFTVGIGDFALLASNYNQTLPAAGGRPGAVPEPVGFAALAIAAIIAGRRRSPRQLQRGR